MIGLIIIGIVFFGGLFGIGWTINSVKELLSVNPLIIYAVLGIIILGIIRTLQKK